MNLVVVSFPENLNTEHPTGLSACAAWKAAGLIERIAQYANRAVWAGLQPQIPTGTESDIPIANIIKLADAVKTIHTAGAFPLVLGGDRLSTALGILNGLRNAGTEPSIVWFDAHNPLLYSSNPLPAPMALLSGRQSNPFITQSGFSGPVPLDHIVVVGVREHNQLDELDIPIWSADELENTGVDPFDRKSYGSIPLYLHIDLSVLDPAIMPAVIDPVSKGLSLETFISFIDAVTAGVPPVALGISNFHPDRDRENIGLKTSLEAITSAVRILSIE